jgi:chromate reductase
VSRRRAAPNALRSTGGLAMPLKVIAFAGSLRNGSYNKQLARVAAAYARDRGATVTELDLADYPLPVFDEDLEKRDGVPEVVMKLKATFREHDALLISSPEYNSSLSAALKNFIDWLSRPVPGEPALACFRNKTAALFAASPGALGGLRGLVHLRAILGNIGVIVLPDQVAIAKADQAFAPDGSLANPKQAAMVEAAVVELVRLGSAAARP